MDSDRLHTILTTFADPGTPVDLSKGNLLVQINEKAFIGKIRHRDGDIFITDETGEEISASKWLILRVAKLPLLAERILQFIPQTPQFIDPEANLFDTLDDEHLAENEHIPSATTCATKLLGRRFGYTSSVVYLTSDAGEGKTTLIQEMAREQATAYKNRKSDWLLVPIALGGRPFMRFDDMIAGYLTNKLRFPLFYYDAFIELVKLGVIIPAFDGFEETLVINSSGDAYSAIGSLMASLNQQGTVLLSARKAFFEYQELKLQARLYDSIGHNSVGFSRLQLKRWNRGQFIQYAARRRHPAPEKLFDAVAKALHSPLHPLLTRAVLANRLLTVATKERDLSGLLTKLGTTPDDYFPVFVDALIEREATEKWLDSSGEAAQPLLAIHEHRDLLSMIAQEMWIQSTEALKADILELIASLYCESKRKSAAETHQIQQRVKQHALFVPSDSARDQFSFDHEEFRHYFLGLAIAKLLGASNFTRDADLTAVLRKGSLPAQVLTSIRCGLRNNSSASFLAIIEGVKTIALFDSATSFLHENCGQIILHLLSYRNLGPIELANFTFGPECLEAVSFADIKFYRCTFGATGTGSSSFTRCRFIECNFDRLDLNSTTPLKVEDVVFEDSNFNAIVYPGRETAIYDPHAFGTALKTAGFGFVESRTLTASAEIGKFSEDEEFASIQRLMRCFSNRTHITDQLIRTKFGKQSGQILDRLLPKLIEAKAIYEDTYRGGGKQHLYKLSIGMLRLNECLEKSQGSSERFYQEIKRSPAH